MGDGGGSDATINSASIVRAEGLQQVCREVQVAGLPHD